MAALDMSLLVLATAAAAGAISVLSPRIPLGVVVI